MSKPTPSLTSIRFLAAQETSKRQKKRRQMSAFDHGFLAQSSDRCHPEQSIWRAVILQALTDAMCLSKKREAEAPRREALSWLTSFSRDFRTVCDYAGYDPAYAHQQILLRLQLHREGLQQSDSPVAQRILQQFERLKIGNIPAQHRRSAAQMLENLPPQGNA